MKLSDLLLLLGMVLGVITFGGVFGTYGYTASSSVLLVLLGVFRWMKEEKQEGDT